MSSNYTKHSNPPTRFPVDRNFSSHACLDVSKNLFDDFELFQ